jgi:acyl carrier protein
MTPVEQSIMQFIAREILHDPSSSIKPDLQLINEGILDSLALQNLVAFLEDEFEVEIDDDYLMPENFESIRSIAGIIDQIRQ